MCGCVGVWVCGRVGVGRGVGVSVGVWVRVCVFIIFFEFFVFFRFCFFFLKVGELKSATQKVQKVRFPNFSRATIL